MPLYLVLKVEDHPDDSETRTIVGEHQAHARNVAESKAEEHARNLAKDDPSHAYDVAYVTHRYVGRITVERTDWP
jgi:hypothetical protein